MRGEERGADRATGEGVDASEVLCQWMAHVLNNPIPVPGSAFVRNAAAAIPELFAMENDDSPAIAHLRRFLDDAGAAEHLETMQQKLAVDRTALFRGVSETGVRPPYEEFYRSKGEGTMSDMNRLMREAAVAPSESNHERVDYLGNELALAAYLYRQARTAAAAGDRERAETLADRLMHGHLACWAPRYCDAALPYAQTEFFRGFLMAMGEFFEEMAREGE
ncbi:molecular chaperone [uncultured Adlercreutzia sp.]|uniref:TorD/DmsD family molecular chaperone n=1 Tax=uncultured Adlercreutzia sp. TaxID=875803 RepID=UPI002676BB38|nr:molecular chaperone TorD family protein [uncultured Adlercreutzia sp.]